MEKGRHVDRDTFAHVWLAAPFQELSHTLNSLVFTLPHACVFKNTGIGPKTL